MHIKIIAIRLHSVCGCVWSKSELNFPKISIMIKLTKSTNTITDDDNTIITPTGTTMTTTTTSSYKQFSLIVNGEEKYILQYILDKFDHVWIKAIDIAVYLNYRHPIQKIVNTIRDELHRKKYSQIAVVDDRIDPEIPMSTIFINKKGLELFMNGCQPNRDPTFQNWIKSSVFSSIYDLKCTISSRIHDYDRTIALNEEIDSNVEQVNSQMKHIQMLIKNRDLSSIQIEIQKIQNNQKEIIDVKIPFIENSIRNLTASINVLKRKQQQQQHDEKDCVVAKPIVKKSRWFW